MDIKILGLGESCTGCGACVNVCAKKSIALKQDKEGYYIPTIISDSCVSCNLCEKVCPVLTEVPEPVDVSSGFVLYRSDDKSILEGSSSGGAFSLIADAILKRGGIVYGSIFNCDNKRVEVSDSDSVEMSLIRKSKYVESYVGDSFAKIRSSLKEGRRVLFCGTPCQVMGLNRYLDSTKVDKTLLLTLDFVCHGVPSIECLRSFLQRMETKKNVIKNIDFRYKDFGHNIGWRDLCLAIHYQSGDKRLLTRNDYYYYYYYQPFLDDLILRKSCYSCNRVSYSKADITLGDYWATVRHHPELNDNRGLSFVKINTKKGSEEWLSISRGLTLKEIPFEENKNQYRIRDSRTKLSKRNKFFRMASKIGFINTARLHYTKKYIVMKCRMFLSKVKHSILL